MSILNCKIQSQLTSLRLLQYFVILILKKKILDYTLIQINKRGKSQVNLDAI